MLGSRDCPRCRAHIPYSINDLYWWCFNCGFYTDVGVPLDQIYQGHIHNWKVIVGTKTSTHVCQDPSCPTYFVQTLEEYQRDQRNWSNAKYVHSLEFAEKVQKKMEEDRKSLYQRFLRETGLQVIS